MRLLGITTWRGAAVAPPAHMLTARHYTHHLETHSQNFDKASRMCLCFRRPCLLSVSNYYLPTCHSLQARHAY